METRSLFCAPLKRDSEKWTRFQTKYAMEFFEYIWLRTEIFLCLDTKWQWLDFCAFADIRLIWLLFLKENWIKNNNQQMKLITFHLKPKLLAFRWNHEFICEKKTTFCFWLRKSIERTEGKRWAEEFHNGDVCSKTNTLKWLSFWNFVGNRISTKAAESQRHTQNNWHYAPLSKSAYSIWIDSKYKSICHFIGEHK